MGLFSKKPKSSIDPAEFLSLRSELADLRDRFYKALIRSGNDPEFVDGAVAAADAALAKARGEDL